MTIRSLLAVAAAGLIAVATAAIAQETAEEAALDLTCLLPDGENAGDPAAGERPFKRCLTCHTLEEGGKNKVGPNLWGIFGTTSGLVEGFRYSKAMTEAAILWDCAALDGYLENPRKYLKGGKMAFPGVRKPDERKNVIAHLLEKTGAPASGAAAPDAAGE